jgi:hypothetical protein
MNSQTLRFARIPPVPRRVTMTSETRPKTKLSLAQKANVITQALAGWTIYTRSWPRAAWAVLN